MTNQSEAWPEKLSSIGEREENISYCSSYNTRSTTHGLQYVHAWSSLNHEHIAFTHHASSKTFALRKERWSPICHLLYPSHFSNRCIGSHMSSISVIAKHTSIPSVVASHLPLIPSDHRCLPLRVQLSKYERNCPINSKIIIHMSISYQTP